MSEPLLNVMKIMLLAGLYLFFVRVLWSVMNELRDPRRSVAPRAEQQQQQQRSPAPAAPAPPVRAPAMAASSGSAQTIQPSLVRPPIVPEQGVPAQPWAPAAPAALVGSGTLTVVAPPDRVGITYALGSEITIGRAATNGVPLEDTYVSTVHARIFATNGNYFIEDLSSRNGTLLNGHPLDATTALSRSDRLTIGATTLEFS